MWSGGQIDLAREEPFSLGPLIVEPALRQVSIASTSAETIQPRVMQVLVALARAQGQIVSRDALVRQCWEGRIVGDDSINRVISQLRRLAADRGEGCFQIETITKVGYRLTGAAAAKIDAGHNTPSDRYRRFTPPYRTNAVVWTPMWTIVMAVIALAWFARGRLGLDKPERQVIAVENFSLGPGVSPAFAQNMRSEVIDFLANDRFYDVSTTAPDPARRDTSWLLRGRLAKSGDRTIAFAQLLKPGSDEAAFSLRIERDTGQPMLARSLGLRIGRTAGCVMLTVTDPDLTGGYVQSALPQMASSCVTWHDKTTTQTARIDAFRENVAALPQSAYFRARLAELLGDRAASSFADAPKARIEGAQLISQAARIDPGQPHILLARARLQPPKDYVGREKQLLLALKARLSDCACEFGDYSTLLLSVGRTAEARAFAARARERQPKNIPWMRLAGEAAAAAGDFDFAKAQLTQVAHYFPDPGSLDDARISLALWSHDWPQAKLLVLRQPPGMTQTALLELVEALSGGNARAAGNIAMRLEAMSQAGAIGTRLAVVALGVADRPAAAAVAAERWLDRAPLDTSLLFEPSFARIRQMPVFSGLLERRGLVAYWRATKTRPDFCAGANAPPVCSSL